MKIPDSLRPVLADGIQPKLTLRLGIHGEGKLPEERSLTGPSILLAETRPFNELRRPLNSKEARATEENLARLYEEIHTLNDKVKEGNKELGLLLDEHKKETGSNLDVTSITGKDWNIAQDMRLALYTWTRVEAHRKQGLPLAEALDVAAQEILDKSSYRFIATFDLSRCWVEHWYQWAELGFPRVQLPHRYAAMLMATSIAESEIPNVKVPWANFIIEMPEGLWPKVHLGAVDLDTVRSVYVRTTNKGVRLEWQGTWASFYDDFDNLSDALQSPTAFNKDIEALPEQQEVFDRVKALTVRLILGISIAMTERALWTEQKTRFDPSVGSPRKIREVGIEPVSRLYKIGRAVKLDLRQEIRSYITGERKGGPVTVRCLVAGHWKNQVHGKGHKLRKWMHIEPYWRGPEDAPVLVRPHVIR